MRELRAGGRPRAILLARDVDRVVDQAHALVGILVFKGVAVLLSVVHDELDDLRRGVRDLDRIGLDVGDGESAFLHLVL